MKIHITGKFPDSVYSKDLILYIAGRYGIELAQYKSIEWGGPCVGEMTLASRMVMSNMSIELGAKFGLFEVDDKILDYLSTRTTHRFEPVKSDKDATYDSKFSVDVSDLEPYVTAPHSLANSKPVSELQGTPVDQAFIGSCANARYEDLEAAARVLKGHKVSSSTRFDRYARFMGCLSKSYGRRASQNLCRKRCSSHQLILRSVHGWLQRCIGTRRKMHLVFKQELQGQDGKS